MAKQSKPADVITFPCSFRLSSLVFYGLAIFTGWCMYGVGYALHHGSRESVFTIGLITVIAAGLFAAAATTIVRIDGTGIDERWLFVRKFTPWSEVAVMDRHRSGCTLQSQAGRDLIAITLLTVPEQDAIAQEAINRAGLRISREKQKYPVKERWTK